MNDKLPKIKIDKKILFIVLISFFSGLIGGFLGNYLAKDFTIVFEKFKIGSLQQFQQKESSEYLPQTSQEDAIISTFKDVSPSVVSIIISKDLPIFEEYYLNPFEPFGGDPFGFLIPQRRQKGIQKQEIGGGTGFVVSSDGMILTNRHVVSDKDAEYTVLTNDGKRFTAKVLARDPVQDIAVIKIDENNGLVPVKLGDSDKLQIGQAVVAIGNVLGEFRNSVSVGVISGLGRTISALGGGAVETLEDVIQTDAAINQGNSGGPLLNLKGEVIGMNTAMVLSAQNIGFAIPINKAKRSIEQVKNLGKIVYPFLGVRYTLINESIQKENKLPVDYGAWIISSAGESAITPGSAAQKAGLKEGDIILEIAGERVTTDNSLVKIIIKYNPGNKVNLKILRRGEEKIVEVTLDERKE